jgi:hypothetical protein
MELVAFMSPITFNLFCGLAVPMPKFPDSVIFAVKFSGFIPIGLIRPMLSKSVAFADSEKKKIMISAKNTVFLQVISICISSNPFYGIFVRAFNPQ